MLSNTCRHLILSCYFQNTKSISLEETIINGLRTGLTNPQILPKCLCSELKSWNNHGGHTVCMTRECLTWSGRGRRISHVPGPGPDLEMANANPPDSCPWSHSESPYCYLCQKHCRSTFALKKLSLVISYGSWVNDSSVGWQILWQKYRGGTSKPEQKVRGHDPQFCGRTEHWRSGHRGYRSTEEGLLKQKRRSGDVTLSSAGELSPEGSGYKGGETPGRKHGSEAQKGHIDDSCL